MVLRSLYGPKSRQKLIINFGSNTTKSEFVFEDDTIVFSAEEHVV